MRGSTCVDRREEEALELLTSRHVLFSCEGRAEQVIMEGDELCGFVWRTRIVGATRVGCT